MGPDGLKKPILFINESGGFAIVSLSYTSATMLALDRK